MSILPKRPLPIMAARSEFPTKGTVWGLGQVLGAILLSIIAAVVPVHTTPHHPLEDD